MDSILVNKGTITTYIRDVIVDKDFHIGKYEVTQAEWRNNPYSRILQCKINIM